MTQPEFDGKFQLNQKLIIKRKQLIVLDTENAVKLMPPHTQIINTKNRKYIIEFSALTRKINSIRIQFITGGSVMFSPTTQWRVAFAQRLLTCGTTRLNFMSILHHEWDNAQYIDRLHFNFRSRCLAAIVLRSSVESNWFNVTPFHLSGGNEFVFYPKKFDQIQESVCPFVQNKKKWTVNSVWSD